MSEYTKLTAPWIVSNISGRTSIVTRHSGMRMVVAVCDDVLQSCGDDGVLHPIQGDEPHVLKMVAAPELLEALQGIVAHEASPDFTKWSGLIAAAQSAIDKALGQSE